jgi:hypothetical protein
MASEEAVVGREGTLIVATRGADGPGEVLVKVRGGSETYFAWSAEPLAKGITVLVYDSRGERNVDVMEWQGDLLDDLSG